MFDNEKNIKDILTTIERRFQFVIVLALFLPSIWNDVSAILLKAIPTIADKVSFGIIIAYVLTAYILLEIFKKIITKNFLITISYILLTLSYTLVVVISFASGYKIGDLVGWKLTFFTISAIAVPFLCFFLTTTLLFAMLRAGWVEIKRQWNKRK